MVDYLTQHGTRQTIQRKPMRKDQVPNSEGGFVWEVDCWGRLRRFLILGSEGGSYYANERDLTTENVESVRECIEEDGPRTVDEIVEISKSGRAPKNDPALFALANCISLGDKKTKSLAAEALPEVARIATHLYHFVAYAETMRGWGRTMKWAVQNWYDKNPDQLALQAIKYRQRDGWSHRDLLRLAHPQNAQNAPIFDWITHGLATTKTGAPKKVAYNKLPAFIQGFEEAQHATTEVADTVRLISEFNLPREALKTEHLNAPEVWRAMLDKGMPMTALIRNLATMTRLDIFKSNEYKNLVVDQIVNQETLTKARIHPLNVLSALKTYASGHGRLGHNTWSPVMEITDALDTAFYLAFDNVQPTNMNHMLALDISSSMTARWGYSNLGFTPREGSAAMALVTLHAEKNVEIVGFHHNLIPLNISRRQRLDDVVNYINRLGFGSTDCSLPMLHAERHSRDTEAFIVYTDSETFAGRIHPKQALDAYRNSTGINARSVVVGMVANSFSIADPNDTGMLDVVGFDAAAPSLISEFVAGNI